MYYSGIKNNDIANGTGVRVSLFVSGCTNRCVGCFQPETWDPRYGNVFTDKVKDELFDMVDHPHISGLSLLGGDPLYEGNRKDVYKLLEDFNSRFGDKKTIWLYTGYDYVDLIYDNIKSNSSPNDILDIFSMCDVIVDGPFIESMKDISLTFKGSANQRFIYPGKSDILSKTNNFIKYKTNYHDDVFKKINIL